MPKNNTAELTAYKLLRSEVAERLAIVSPDPRAPSAELRTMAEYLLVVCDHQAGQSSVSPAQQYPHVLRDTPYKLDDLDAIVRQADLLASREWQRGAIFHLTVQAANAVAAA